MKPKKPLISVIIPHLNQPDGLAVCLGSLYSQVLERSAFEVIVVDNGSAAPPPAVVGRYPGTLFFPAFNTCTGPGRNSWVEAARARLFALPPTHSRMSLLLL